MPTTTDHLRKAPVHYKNKLMRNFSQKSLKLTGINDRYPHFASVHFIAGDEEQFNAYRSSDSSTRLHFAESPNDTFHATIDSKVHEVYHGTLSRPVVTDTFRYIFHKFKKGIYVKIRNGALETFLPFSNAHFVNEYGTRLDPDGTSTKLFREISKMDGYSFNPRKVNGFNEKWFANNCLVRYEYPIAENDTNLCAIRDMLDALVETGDVPDYDFFINKRDYPILAEGKYEPYNHIFDSKTYPLVSHAYSAYAPIFSFSAADRHSDVIMPTVDDWIRIASSEERFFCKTSNDYFPVPKSVAWEDKRNVAIWRGSSTGAGTTVQTNKRLKLSKLSQRLMLAGSMIRLDAGITSWKRRPRKIEGVPGLQTINTKATKLELVNKIPFDRHCEYKYIVHVEGHTAAYRLGAELGLGSVVLIVEGEYKLWFQRFLVENEHYVSVKADLSDLEDKIEWLMENDDKAKSIAENGVHFFNRYLTKKGILDYMRNTLFALSRKMPLDAWIDRPVPEPRRVELFPHIYVHVDKNLKTSKKSKVDQGKIGGIAVVVKQSDENLFREYNIGRRLVNNLPSANFAKTLYFIESTNSLVLEYVEGPTLLEKLQADDFSESDLCEILIKTLTAIKVAQDFHKFTHNDLSVSNVICKKVNFYKPIIIDFGRSTAVTDNGQTLACSYMKFSKTQDCMHLVMSTLFHVCRRRDATTYSKLIRLLSTLVAPSRIDTDTDIVRWAIRFTEIEGKFSRITNPFSNRKNPYPEEVISKLQEHSPCHCVSPRSLVNFFVKKEVVKRKLKSMKMDAIEERVRFDMADHLLNRWRGIDSGNEAGKKLVARLVGLVNKKLAAIDEWDLSWLEEGLKCLHRARDGDKTLMDILKKEYRRVIDWRHPEKLSIGDAKLLLHKNASEKFAIIVELKKNL